MFEKKSSISVSGTLTKIMFFSLMAGALTASAQNINSDLQPKKKVVRPASRTKPVRATKPRSKPAARKQPVKTAPPTVVSQPVVQPAANPQSVAAPVAEPPAPIPSAQQVIERFMNFQQSGGVTSKDWEAVINQAGAAVQAYPNDASAKAQVFVGQGFVAFNRDDYSTALIQFNAAQQVLPNSALPYYGIGHVYLKTKQAQQAAIAFERAIKLKKDFALAYKGLGDAMMAQGKTKKAQEHFKEAAQIGLVESQTTGANSNTPGNRGSGNGQNTNSGNAQNNAQNTAAPTEPAYDAELKSARALTAGKKWQSSLSKLLPLAQTSPTSDLYVAIGDNYFGMQQWLSAQQAYRKAAELNPQSAPAFYKSGMVLFEMNEFQAAAEAFEKALILDQSGASINRAQTRKMADRAKEKAEHMKKGNKKGFLGL